MKLPRQNLRLPGPTPVPPEVTEATGGPMINHRGPEFKEIIIDLTEKLKRVCMTQNDLYILTASGTGCLEAAVVNTLSPGDKVLGVTVGSFGDRFAEMAQAYGARVSRLEFPWGSAADPEAIRDALAKDPEIKAVLVTHNETSTGVTNDLESISQVVKEEFDKLLLVDAVSSLGCVALPVDQWKCDMVGTACQKGLLAPPGLSIICVSPQAWEANKEAKMPRYYFDLATAQRYLERGQTPWTPNLPLFYGLMVAVDLLLEEGMGHVFERHGQIAQMTREGVKALGLELLADPRHASDTVTAVKLPVGVDGEQLTELLRLERNVVVAEGLGKLAGKIFRIGHMGHVKEEDIQETLDALSWALPKVGFKLGHSVPGLGR